MLNQFEDLGAMLAALSKPAALIELAVLLCCGLLAWGIVRMLRGNRPPEHPSSIVFGRRIFDGVLFPMLALAIALGARYLLSDYLPIVVFRIAIPILLSLMTIRLGVRVLRAAFPDSALIRVVERSLSWFVWVLMVLWTTGFLPLMLDAMNDVAWTIGSSKVTLRNMVEGTVSAVVVLVLALWVSAAIETSLLRGATGNLSVRKIVANAVRAMLLFVGLLLALSAAGIDLRALSVLGGAIGVGIGFGLQKLASNYVSGFVILAERSLRIGDIVKVDNFEGRITDINTRYTVIRALNGRESIVPNELLITSRVENASLADSNLSLSTRVQVAYGTQLDGLMPQIAQAVLEVPRVLSDPAPGVMLSAFGADGLDLTISFWISDPENGQGNVVSGVNLAILRTLEEYGAEIPYPQRVVHMKPPPAA